MTTLPKNKPWDFSQVLGLVNALSSPQPSERSIDYLSARSAPVTSIDHANGIASKDFAPSPVAGLGDFGKIWHFLGTPPPQKEHLGLKDDGDTNKSFTSKADYTSDGAIRYGLQPKSSKKVTWKEDTSADEPTPDSASDRSPTPILDQPKLTKSQRKKQNRRARKAREAFGGQGTVSESEADSVWFATPARKASTHAVSPQPGHDYTLRSWSAIGTRHRSEAGLPICSETGGDDHKHARIAVASTGSPMPARPDAAIRQTSQPLAVESRQPILKQNVVATPQWPIPRADNNSTPRFLPASVSPKVVPPRDQHSQANSAAEAVRAVQAAQAELRNDKSSAKTPIRQHGATFAKLPTRQPSIEPKIVRTGEDRHWALFLKLIDEFGEDRKHLIAPMNLTTHNNDDKGIHVFVDASNIFIGFNDQLKRSRGIPVNAKVPPVSLSFDALALLMERRRPVAKRVLAGSTPHLPAFDKAKAVGYECNILEKVYKARELTERQIFFRDVDRRQNRRAKAARSEHGNAGLLSTSPSNGYLSATDDATGAVSGSETTTTGPQYARAAMIEQGVDEILHLKIAHSVMDYETPATMVLATGDAAQAEYSDGFMAMVQRALVKGWKVELVSWSKNISSMYLKSSFAQTWGDNFRVILLDDYAEELLDM